MTQWTCTKAVELVSIVFGADIEIDLTAISVDEPLFAYVDDAGDGAAVLHGLESCGRLTIEGQGDFMWLHGPRECQLFKPTEEGLKSRKVALRSLAVGEFCLEVYLVRPDAGVELIAYGDFCFK